MKVAISRRLNSWPVALLLGFALAGCANDPPPKAQMAASQTALEQARMSGADQGAAAADFNAAQQKLERAEAAYRARDYALAQRLASEAEVDAQLAQARTGSAKSTQALAEINAGIRAMRDEIQRSTTRP